MTINWYGQTCFKISGIKSKEAQIEILIDPLKEGTGLRGPKNEADIVISTEQDRKGLSGGFLVSGPGEYDVKEVYIHGIDIKDGNTAYVIDAEDIKICHAGLFDKELTSEQLEKIGDVDILMLAVGSDPKSAIKLMSQIEPKITIPMHYHVPGLKEKTGGVDVFLKAIGIRTPEQLPKLTIKKKDIGQDDAKIIVLQP